jgi:hypothetical protein
MVIKGKDLYTEADPCERENGNFSGETDPMIEERKGPLRRQSARSC